LVQGFLTLYISWTWNDMLIYLFIPMWKKKWDNYKMEVIIKKRRDIVIKKVDFKK
jgi:hypothetical protein